MNVAKLAKSFEADEKNESLGRPLPKPSLLNGIGLEASIKVVVLPDSEQFLDQLCRGLDSISRILLQ